MFSHRRRYTHITNQCSLSLGSCARHNYAHIHIHINLWQQAEDGDWTQCIHFQEECVEVRTDGESFFLCSDLCICYIVACRVKHEYEHTPRPSSHVTVTRIQHTRRDTNNELAR